MRGGSTGDQYVEVQVEVNKKLSKEEKELYKKLQDLQKKSGKETVFEKFKKAFK